MRVRELYQTSLPPSIFSILLRRLRERAFDTALVGCSAPVVRLECRHRVGASHKFCRHFPLMCSCKRSSDRIAAYRALFHAQTFGLRWQRCSEQMWKQTAAWRIGGRGCSLVAIGELNAMVALRSFHVRRESRLVHAYVGGLDGSFRREAGDRTAAAKPVMNHFRNETYLFLRLASHRNPPRRMLATMRV
jgi:hypothetical protein